jgi:hypothetical protein
MCIFCLYNVAEFVRFRFLSTTLYNPIDYWGKRVNPEEGKNFPGQPYNLTVQTSFFYAESQLSIENPNSTP